MTMRKFSELPSPLRLFLTTSAALYLSTLLFCGLAFAFHGRFEWKYFLFRTPGSWFAFGDFAMFTPRFRELWHTPAFYDHVAPNAFLYPAPVAILFKLFFKLPSHATIFFVSSLLCIATGTGLLLARQLQQHNLTPKLALFYATSVTVLSYPLAMVMIRANVELYLWAFMAAGIWALSRGKDSTAAVLLGIAASMKLLPVVLLAVFLLEKKWKPAILGCLTFGIVTASSLLILGPNLIEANRHISDGVQQFINLYGMRIRPMELPFDHSLIATAKHFVPETKLPRLIKLYSALSSVLLLGITFGLLPRLPRINRLLALLIMIVLFPVVSSDYTLMTMHIAWGLLAFYILEHKDSVAASLQQLKIWMIGLALVLAPESFLVAGSTRLSGIFKCLVLLGLLVYSLASPIQPVSEEMA